MSIENKVSRRDFLKVATSAAAGALATEAVRGLTSEQREKSEGDLVPASIEFREVEANVFESELRDSIRFPRYINLDGAEIGVDGKWPTVKWSNGVIILNDGDGNVTLVDREATGYDNETGAVTFGYREVSSTAGPVSNFRHNYGNSWSGHLGSPANTLGVAAHRLKGIFPKGEQIRVYLGRSKDVAETGSGIVYPGIYPAPREEGDVSQRLRLERMKETDGSNGYHRIIFKVEKSNGEIQYFVAKSNEPYIFPAG